MAADIVVYTDRELFRISDEVVGLHLDYHVNQDLYYLDRRLISWAKQAGIPTMRYPGGTQLKTWDWQQPSATTWDDPWDPEYEDPNIHQSRFVSLDEYLTLCRLMGIEKPLVGINHTSGEKFDRRQDSIDRAAALVRYVKDAGFPGAHYYLGNEDMHLLGGYSDYAELNVMYARAMRAVDPDIRIYGGFHLGITGRVYGRYVEKVGPWLDGVDTHPKYPGRHADMSISEWRAEVPLMDRFSFEHPFRDMDRYRRITAKLGYPDFKFLNLEWVAEVDGTGLAANYEYSLQSIEMLMELFVGNWEITSFWDNVRWNPPSKARMALLDTEIPNAVRLNPVHYGMQWLARSHGAMMLHSTSSNPLRAHGFAALGDDGVHVYLLNKSKKRESVTIRFDGPPKIDAGAGLQAEILQDKGSHGRVKPLTVKATRNGTAVEAVLPSMTFAHFVFPVATLDETAAPDVPQGLSATAGEDGVVLRWEANRDDAIHEYRLWRSTETGASFELLATDLKDPTFIDATAVSGIDYFYAVQAADTSGQVSGLSSELRYLQPVQTVFHADFQASDSSIAGDAANLDAGTSWGYWSGLPASGTAVVQDDNNIASKGLKIDRVPGGFAIDLNLGAPIALDGAEVGFRAALSSWGGQDNDIVVTGLDAEGAESFSIVLSGTKGRVRRLGYVNPDRSVAMFDEGAEAELAFLEQMKPDDMNKVAIQLREHGFVVDFDWAGWTSKEVAYAGEATTISRIRIASTSGVSGLLLDDIEVTGLLPVRDSNETPLRSSNTPLRAAVNVGDHFRMPLASRFSDADGDVLTFEKVSGPYWLQIQPGGVAYGVPGSEHEGIGQFVVRASDPYGGRVTGTFQVVVQGLEE